MSNPMMTFGSSTLTFRPGCIQPLRIQEESRQRRRESSNGSVRIREVSDQTRRILGVTLQNLHEADEGVFSGWDSLNTFLASTVDMSKNEFTFLDADGESRQLRLMDPQLAVREIQKGIFSGDLNFLVRSLSRIGIETFTDDDLTVPTDLVPDLGFDGWSEITGGDVGGGTYNLWVVSNSLRFNGNSGTLKRFVLVSDVAIIPTTSWEFRTTWQRSTQTAGDHRGGVSAFLNAADDFLGASGWPQGIHVWLGEVGASAVKPRLLEVDENGVTVLDTTTTLDNVVLAGTDSLDVGMTVNADASAATLWTEPPGGGTRTQHTTESITTDFHGLGHLKVGPSGDIASAGTTTMFFDDVHFES